MPVVSSTESSALFSSALSDEEERALSPSCGVRCSSIYSIPLSAHILRFSSEPPSALTTKMSGLTISRVGRKSIIPLPSLI